MCANWIFGILLTMLGVLGSNSTGNEVVKEAANNYTYAVYSIVLSILLLFLYSYSFTVYEIFYSLQRKMYSVRRTYYRLRNRLRGIQLPNVPYIARRNARKFVCTILVALYITILYASVWFSLFDVGKSLTLVIWLALLTKPLNELILNFTTEISINVQLVLRITFFIVTLIGFLAVVFFWMLNGILTMIIGMSVFMLLNYMTYVRQQNATFRHMNGCAFNRIVNAPPPDRELPFIIRLRLEDRLERERMRNEARIDPHIEDLQADDEMNNEADILLHELRDIEINNVSMTPGVNEQENNIMNDAEDVERDLQEDLNKEKETLNHSQKVEERNDEMRVAVSEKNKESLLTNVKEFMDKYFKTESNNENTNGCLNDDPVGDFERACNVLTEASNRESSEYENECNEWIESRSTGEIKIIGTVIDGIKEQQEGEHSSEIELSNEYMPTKSNVFESYSSCSDVFLRHESSENLASHTIQLSTMIAKESDELCSYKSLSLDDQADVIMEYNLCQLEHSHSENPPSGRFDNMPKDQFKQLVDLESNKSRILKENPQHASNTEEERYLGKFELIAINKDNIRDLKEHSSHEHEATLEMNTFQMEPVSSSHSTESVAEYDKRESYSEKLESGTVLVSAEKECEMVQPENFEETTSGSISLSTPKVGNEFGHSPSKTIGKSAKRVSAGIDEQDADSDKPDSAESDRMNFENASEHKSESYSEKSDCRISSDDLIIKYADYSSTLLLEETLNVQRQNVRLPSFKTDADTLLKSVIHARKDKEQTHLNESRETERKLNLSSPSSVEHMNVPIESPLVKLREMESKQLELEASNSTDDASKAHSHVIPQSSDDLSPENSFKIAAKELDSITMLLKESIDKLTEIVPYTRREVSEYSEELQSIEAEKNNYLSLSDCQSPDLARIKNKELEAEVLKMLSDTTPDSSSDSSSTSDTDFESNSEYEIEKTCFGKLEREAIMRNLVQIRNLDSTKNSLEIPIMNSGKKQLRSLASSINEALDAIITSVPGERNEEKVNFEGHKCKELDRNGITNRPNYHFDNDTNLEISGDTSEISCNVDLTPISNFEEDEKLKIFKEHTPGNSDLPYKGIECHKNGAKSSANIPLPVYNCNAPKKELKTLAASLNRIIDEFPSLPFAKEDKQDKEYSEAALDIAGSTSSNTDSINTESSDQEESGISEIQGSKFPAESVVLQDIESESRNTEGVKTERNVPQERWVYENPNTERSSRISTEEGAVNAVDTFFIYNVPNALK